MATVNLAEKYASKLDERFVKGSVTDAFVGTDYDWEGVNAIKVWTLDTPELINYDLSKISNRFGDPSEVDDELSTYTLSQKKAFTKTFDATYVQDQNFKKKSAAYLKQMWDERYVPAIDAYRLNVWANGAGLGVLNATALDKDTIMEAILKAHAALDDADVPTENRVTFVRADVAVACKLASEMANNQNWTDKAVVKGKIAEINCSPVVTVPTSRMPAGVEFMIKYKRATADPVKLRLLRANDNAPGIAGTLMEGLVRYDAFVLSQKADGIFVYAEKNYLAAPTISADVTTVTIAGPDGATVKYTVDGSNPKVKSTDDTETVHVYGGTFTAPTGSKIRAYAYKDGSINSPIASFTVV